MVCLTWSYLMRYKLETKKIILLPLTRSGAQGIHNYYIFKELL